MHLGSVLSWLVLPATLGLMSACTGAELDMVDPVDEQGEFEKLGPGCGSSQGTSVPVGLSSHFRTFLAQSEYSGFDFNRADIDGGSFGGFASSSDCIERQPVIFIHGNSDRALGGGIGGWEDSVAEFTSRGYRRAELYGTTYGPASALQASNYYHSRENILQVRRFIEAVLDYTGADKVDIISHSMGVTLARKAIKGGSANDLADGGDYFIGGSLSDRVDTFVGIAGGNQGLASCYLAPTTPTCGTTNGFYPGFPFGLSIIGQSNIIQDVNDTRGYEGDFRYSIWSTVDEVVGGACLVWGQNTCRVPGHTGEKVYGSFPFGHIGVRDHTTSVQFHMVANHQIP